SRTRPHPSSPDQPAQGWWKDGHPGRPARRPAACPGRKGPERQSHNEGNYASTVLGTRGVRPAYIPRVLTPKADSCSAQAHVCVGAIAEVHHGEWNVRV